MWQETRQNLQTGAFGDPASIQTLILFWSKMEMLHYPGAGETKAYLEEQLQMQQLAAQQQAAMEQQLALRQAQQGLPGGTAQAVMQQAQADAASDIQQTGAVTA